MPAAWTARRFFPIPPTARRSSPLALAVLLALALLASLGGCAARGSLTDADETYTGPLALAILPVAEGRPAATPEVSRWWVQKLLAEDLDRSGLFAGVIPLPDADRAHEAGLVLAPRLTELTWRDPGQRSGTIALRVRLLSAESGQLRFDRVYRGSCQGCTLAAGQPPAAGPLAELLKDLRRDLARELAHR